MSSYNECVLPPEDEEYYRERTEKARYRPQDDPDSNQFIEPKERENARCR